MDPVIQPGDRIVRARASVNQLYKSTAIANIPGQSTFERECEIPAHFILTPPTGSSVSPHGFSASGPSTVGVCKQTRREPEWTAEFRNMHGHTEAPNTHHSIQNPSVRSGSLKELSQTLHQLLPSPADAERIVEACGSMSTLFFRMNGTPTSELEIGGSISPKRLFARPGPTTHPVLIARYMLHVATFLQHMHPGVTDLSEPPRKIMDRLADAVANLVIANDHLVACIEGLECMVIQSWYQVNGGNLRKAFIGIRRAITIAQLMGFHRFSGHIQCKVLNPQTEAHPQFLWFRCVSLERHICMMLGLSQTTLDQSMASEAVLDSDTPMGRLERIHCVIASRILERNDSVTNLHDYSLTQSIDRDLQKAATALPCKWWLPADLATVKDEPDTLFWEMRRLFHQLYHYNLLVQLHLPYMIKSSSGQNFDYSRITCVNAAREVLSRFLMFRNFNRFAFSCRTFDFFCLMAAMTLLLGHLDGHRRVASATTSSPGHNTTTSDSLLAHQRPGDRALIEKIQESTEKISLVDGDVLSTESAGLLRQLMNIEAEAADGSLPGAKNIDTQMTSELHEAEENPLQLQIPYLGIIQITRSGLISKLRKPQSNFESTRNDFTESALEGAVDAVPDKALKHCLYSNGVNNRYHTEATTLNNMGQSLHTSSPVELANVDHLITPPAILRSPSSLDEPTMRGLGDPLFTAGAEDWAFQGIDMAFFDNLMRWNEESVSE